MFTENVNWLTPLSWSADLHQKFKLDWLGKRLDKVKVFHLVYPCSQISCWFISSFRCSLNSVCESNDEAYLMKYRKKPACHYCFRALVPHRGNYFWQYIYGSISERKFLKKYILGSILATVEVEGGWHCSIIGFLYSQLTIYIGFDHKNVNKNPRKVLEKGRWVTLH